MRLTPTGRLEKQTSHSPAGMSAQGHIATMYRDEKACVIPRGGSTNSSANVAVWQADKNQHCQDLCGDTERGLLAVPFLRLPHREVFARDNRKAEKPEGKAD